MKISIDDDKILRAEAENNVDLYNYIQSRIKEKTRNYWKNIRDMDSGDNLKWYGGIEFDDVMDELLLGNKNQTQEFLSGIKEQFSDDVAYSQIYFDNEGFAYDMGAVVSGEPECCLNMGAPESKKFITIGIDYSFPCYVKPDVLRNRGMAITNLVHSLITQGYVVNLRFLQIYNPHNTRNVTKSIFSLDLNTENLSISTVAFYCSVEFFRAIMILVHSMLDELPELPGEGMGSDDKDEFFDIFGEDMLFIPAGYTDESMRSLTSVEKANKKILNLFNDWNEKMGAQDVSCDL